MFPGLLIKVEIYIVIYCTKQYLRLLLLLVSFGALSSGVKDAHQPLNELLAGSKSFVWRAEMTR